MAIGGTRGRRDSKRRSNRVSINSNTNTLQESIVHNLTGRKWPVHYFHKQLAEDETGITFDLNQQVHLQNFNYIENMPLWIQSEIPLDGSLQDISGSAYVDVLLKPTIGDIFIGIIAGYTNVLMSVKEVSRSKYNNTGIYLIEYSAIKLLESDIKMRELLGVLKPAIIESLVYDSEHSLTNSNPLILPATLDALSTISDLIEEVEPLLYKHEGVFPSLLTLDTGKAYDVNMSTFTDSITSYKSIPTHSINYPRVAVNLKPSNTILDVLLDDLSLNGVNPYVGILIGDIPVQDIHTDILLSDRLTVESRLTEVVETDITSSTFIYENQIYQTSATNTITSSGTDGIPGLQFNTYIFSKAFYVELGIIKDTLDETGNDTDVGVDANTGTTEDNTSGSDEDNNGVDVQLTRLEIETIKAVRRDTLSGKEIISLLNASHNFNRNELTYFLPIILHLAKEVVKYRIGDF